MGSERLGEGPVLDLCSSVGRKGGRVGRGGERGVTDGVSRRNSGKSEERLCMVCRRFVLVSCLLQRQGPIQRAV